MITGAVPTVLVDFCYLQDSIISKYDVTNAKLSVKKGFKIYLITHYFCWRMEQVWRFCSVAMLSTFLSAELLLSKQIMGQDEKNILPCHNKGIRKFYQTFIVLNRGGSRKFFLGVGGVGQHPPSSK